MNTYQAHNIGKLENIDQYVFAPPGAPIRLEGKVFLRELLGLTSMEISLNKNPPGTGVDFFHRHKNHEEVYIFLGGNGEMMVDGDRFSVGEGTAVRIAPSASRAWWNTGDTDLYYIVTQSETDALKTEALDDGEFLEAKVPWV